MSDLSATNCGCGCGCDRGGSGCNNSCLWIILLLLFCGGGCNGTSLFSNGCNDGCGCNDNNSCSWIWIILLILICCGGCN